MSQSMLLTLIVVGLIASGCTKQQDQNTASQPAAVQADVQAQAMAQAQAVEAQAQEQAKAAAKEAQEVAQKAAADAQAVAQSAIAKIQELLAQAKQLVDQGKLDEAITKAQAILSMDPNNIDAKNIIETAKAKLAELAQQKMGDIKAGVASKLGAFGK